MMGGELQGGSKGGQGTGTKSYKHLERFCCYPRQLKSQSLQNANKASAIFHLIGYHIKIKFVKWEQNHVLRWHFTNPKTQTSCDQIDDDRDSFSNYFQ